MESRKTALLRLLFSAGGTMTRIYPAHASTSLSIRPKNSFTPGYMEEPFAKLFFYPLVVSLSNHLPLQRDALTLYN